MDTISISKTEWHEGEEGITFLINGRDLLDIVMEHGGGADVLLVRSICYGREDTVFREHSRLLDERLVALACMCGSPFCGSITVRVRRSERTVTWSDFAPAWRGRPLEYHKIGPFTFDRDQYENVLEMGRRFCRDLESKV
jgi:hypothetical protein